MQIAHTHGLGVTLRGSATSVALACESAQITDEDILVSPEEQHTYKVQGDRMVFDWPGEYEQSGVMVTILETGKAARGRIAKVIIDDISCAHIMHMTEPLSDAEESDLGSIDILFVPLNGAVADKEIQNIIEALEPKMVIPVAYASLEKAKEFAKKLGSTDVEATAVLKLKKSDLNSERMEVKVVGAQQG